jgi:hypothetical protein
LRSLQSAEAELAALDTVILAVSFRPADFNKDLCAREGFSFHTLSDPNREAVRQYNVWNAEENVARRVTFWIDREGVIRRVWREVTPLTMGKDIVEFLRQWNRGKVAYATHCARCHGDDGNATGYPGIQRIGGLGNRLSEEEIDRATEASGIVDLNQLSPAERKALFVYAAGL